MRLPAVALLWLLHFLPLSLIAAFGRALGLLLYYVGARRRRIVQVNLALCFPELNEAQRRQLAKDHFKALARSFLERAIFWWASAERLERLIHVEGDEKIRALRAA